MDEIYIANIAFKNITNKEREFISYTLNSMEVTKKFPVKYDWIGEEENTYLGLSSTNKSVLIDLEILIMGIKIGMRFHKK